jgi:hypothetical protein
VAIEETPPKWPAHEVPAVFTDWTHLTDDLQLALSREALSRAAVSIASQAEMLAEEMESGNLADRGGPDALRLFAAVVRVGGKDELAPAGRA